MISPNDGEPDTTAFEEAEWDNANSEDEANPVFILEQGANPTHRREANKLDALLTKVTYGFLYNCSIISSSDTPLPHRSILFFVVSPDLQHGESIEQRD